MAKSRAFCSVDGCRNKTTNKSLSFFQLPKDKERRNKWLKIIGRPDLMNRNNLRPSSHIVCSVHFEKNMILHTPRLHPDAMPTKHLPSPPSTSTSKSETESNTKDASTQTNLISKQKFQNASCETSSVQSEDINMEKQPQTSVSVYQDNPRKKVYNNSNESEQKQRRLESAIQKIEKR